MHQRSGLTETPNLSPSLAWALCWCTCLWYEHSLPPLAVLPLLRLVFLPIVLTAILHVPALVGPPSWTILSLPRETRSQMVQNAPKCPQELLGTRMTRCERTNSSVYEIELPFATLCERWCRVLAKGTAEGLLVEEATSQEERSWKGVTGVMLIRLEAACFGTTDSSQLRSAPMAGTTMCSNRLLLRLWFEAGARYSWGHARTCTKRALVRRSFDRHNPRSSAGTKF